MAWCFPPIRSVQIPSTPGEQKRRFTWFKTALRLVITHSTWRTEFGLIPVHIAITSQNVRGIIKRKEHLLQYTSKHFADFKISHPFKSTNILCKLFKAIISFRRSEEIPEPLSSFNYRNRRTSYFILCLCPNVRRHSFFSILKLHIFEAIHISKFSLRFILFKNSLTPTSSSIIVQISPSTSFSVPSRTTLLIMIFKTDALYRANRASKITAHRQYKKHDPLSFCLLFLPFLLFF